MKRVFVTIDSATKTGARRRGWPPGDPDREPGRAEFRSADDVVRNNIRQPHDKTDPRRDGSMAHGPVGRQPGGSLAASYGEEGAIRRGHAELRIGHGPGELGNMAAASITASAAMEATAAMRKPAATAPALASRGLTCAPPCPEQPIRRESIVARPASAALRRKRAFFGAGG
jgi:hypothetical protein